MEFNARFILDYTPTTHHDAPAKLDPRNVKLPQPCSVLITGAGRGIGAAHAIGFAQAGATDIILTSRTVSQLEEVKAKVLEVNPGIKVSIVPCDVTKEGDMKALEKHVRKHHGRLDVLDVNAGYLDHGFGPVTDIPADEFARVLEINAVGPFLTIRTFLPLMLESEKGLKSIIAVSSATAQMAMESIAMCMSKIALTRFIEYFADKYADQGIVAYAVMPGAVKTEMSTGGGRVPEFVHHMLVDTPELSAAFFVWLAKEPKPWLSGRYCAANWDTDELEAMKEDIVKGDKLKFALVA